MISRQSGVSSIRLPWARIDASNSGSPPSPKLIRFLWRMRPTLMVSATASSPSRPAHTKKTVMDGVHLSIRRHCMAILGDTKAKEPPHVADPAEESRNARRRPPPAGPRQARLRGARRAFRESQSHPGAVSGRTRAGDVRLGLFLGRRAQV